MFTTLLVIILAITTLGLAGCGGNAGAPSGSAASDASAAFGASDGAATSYEPTAVRVASLKGPTSIGLVSFIHEAQSGSAQLSNDFDFTLAGTADEILPKLISGDLDIALVPANAAAVLYNRTNGGVQVLNINTLGVLYLLSADNSVASLKDLAGRTVLMTGKGTTPEYVMNALLSKQGIADVNLEYKSEAAELAAALQADPTAIAVLPQPYVTVVTSKNPEIKIRASLSDEWDASFSDGSRLVTGVTVVRSAFAAEHPQAVDEFLDWQSRSIAVASSDPAAAGALVAELGIIDDAAIAEKAIPYCSLADIRGVMMMISLEGYLNVLAAQDLASVGGALPQSNFYYEQ